MSTPEVRLSPDGTRIAMLRPGDKDWAIHGRGGHCRSRSNDGYVSDWTPLLPVSNQDGDEPFDIALPGGRYYGRWIKVSDHEVTLECGCGYASNSEQLPPVLDRAADELHRGH